MCLLPHKDHCCVDCATKIRQHDISSRTNKKRSIKSMEVEYLLDDFDEMLISFGGLVSGTTVNLHEDVRCCDD